MASLGNRITHSLINLQTANRAHQVGEKHYDLGNDLYTRMLDPLMNYSCGYWQDADSLEQAQIDKLDLICRKLNLKPGEHLLDVGCGWGSLARYAAEEYGVRVTGVTISREQQKLAQENCKHLAVEIRLCDYRSLTGKFDKIASVGMFEHVGKLNYRTYFDTIYNLLADDGLMLLHTIGSYRTHNTTDPWINEYIFPNGQLPSASRITSSIEPNLVIRDWHDFGPDYDKTIMAWWHNFDRHWPEREVWTAILSHVALLPAFLCRFVQIRPGSTLANRVDQERSITRLQVLPAYSVSPPWISLYSAPARRNRLSTRSCNSGLTAGYWRDPSRHATGIRFLDKL
jgi:cyclopropane-fatty-acyl-phospholipid synthase